MAVFCMAKRRRCTIRPKALHSGATTPAYPRPKTRADCIDGPRPCPYLGCRYHLGLDHRVQAQHGQGAGLLILAFGDDLNELRGVKHTCALDVADQGEHSGYQVADFLNISRQRGNQIEQGALRKLRVALAHLPRDVAQETLRQFFGPALPPVDDKP